MNSKKYIMKVLRELHDNFPLFTFRYYFDALDNSHVIEYSPNDLTIGDLEFEDYRYGLLYDYYSEGFEESLVFIDEFDPIGIEEAEIEYKGEFYFESVENILEIKNNDNNVRYNERDTEFIEDIEFSLAA